MTTAAKPTYAPAKGREGDLSKMTKQYSARDMPSHTKLKYRQTGQDTAEELKGKDLRRELEEKEKSAKDKRLTSNRESASTSKRPRLDQISGGNLDADDPIDDDEDEEGSDEDDTAELMAELNRIKKERAIEKAQQEAEKKEEEERIRTENILGGNPLLNPLGKTDFTVKRRWDDDVVFKNCAKGIDEKKEPTFINDSLRSEFHKKFMAKYIK